MSKLLPYALREKIYSDWIKALRSGEYEQTTGRLQDNGGFCCLGVLCDVSSLGDWSELDQDSEFSCATYRTVSTFGDEALLPKFVQGALGINRSGAFKDDENNRIRLHTLNDEDKLDFNQIADIIEENKARIFDWPELKEDAA